MDNPALRAHAAPNAGADELRVDAVAAETRGPAVVEDVVLSGPGIGAASAFLVRPAAPSGTRGPADFEYRRAAGETAEFKRYPGGHDLKVDAARHDRRAFLEKLLAG